MRAVALTIVWTGYVLYGLIILVTLLTPNKDPKPPDILEELKKLQEVPWQFTASLFGVFLVWFVAKSYLTEEECEQQDEPGSGACAWQSPVDSRASEAETTTISAPIDGLKGKEEENK